MNRKTTKEFPSDFNYNINPGSDSLTFVMIAYRLLKTKPIKTHKTFGEIFLGHVGVVGRRISGGDIKKRWIITIDKSNFDIVNVKRERYRIIAKF